MKSDWVLGKSDWVLGKVTRCWLGSGTGKSKWLGDLTSHPPPLYSSLGDIVALIYIN